MSDSAAHFGAFHEDRLRDLMGDLTVILRFLVEYPEDEQAKALRQAFARFVISQEHIGGLMWGSEHGRCIVCGKKTHKTAVANGRPVCSLECLAHA